MFQGLTPPIVADFNNDGQKEVIYSTGAFFVEALIGLTGEKAEGWPLALSETLFLSSPLVYDIDRSGTMDVLVTTEAGDIVFISENGVPLYNYTLKISPLPIRRDWFQSLSGKQSHESYMDISRHRDAETTPNKYRNRAAHLDGLRKNGPSRNSGKDFKSNFPEKLEATSEGIKSLELFLDTKLSYSYVEGLTKQLDPLFSPTYQELEYDEEKEIRVPPHVLATPIIMDLERDGRDELIVPVSYYYTVPQSKHVAKWGIKQEKQVTKFSVTGIVVFDLATHSLKWQSDLGATMTKGETRSFIFSSPVAADLDGNGVLEIVVCDGSGHIHVLDSVGEVVKPWPIKMAPLAAQVIVEDVNGDGKLEIVALDAKGNLACFDKDANELWVTSVYTGSSAPLDNSPTVGDVDGDGSVDIVVGTPAGLLYAFEGSSGKLLKGFPIQFPGEIRAEVTLVHMRSMGLHLVFVSGEWLYMVDGTNPSCVEGFALGDESFSSVVVDDFTNDKTMDLLVTGVNGNVYCFSTDVPYHPLNAWYTPWNGGTKTSANFGYHGIFAVNRENRDVSGSSFFVNFVILDRRKSQNPKYNVTISLNGFPKFFKSYTAPGTYSAQLDIPKHGKFAAVTLWLENDAHQIFTDFFSVSFNVRFYRLLKYVLVAPLVLIALSLIKLDNDAPLLPQDGNRE